MICIECGRDFSPETDEEDICLECQYAWVLENAPELLRHEDDDREEIQPGDYRYYHPRAEEP